MGALSTHDLALTEIAQREDLRGAKVHMQAGARMIRWISITASGRELRARQMVGDCARDGPAGLAFWLYHRLP